MSFEHITGNERIKELLQKIIDEKNILAAYLFIGPDGIGKSLFAKEFAGMILCENEEKKPCGSCKSCLEIKNLNHPDFMIIEPEGDSIKIEQIRRMQMQIINKPIVQMRKVILINDSDKMTKEAQNCLLKTLEEPPSYITIILIGQNENLFLNTIKSRCVSIVFQKIDHGDLRAYLQSQGIENVGEESLELFSRKYKKGAFTKG